MRRFASLFVPRRDKSDNPNLHHIPSPPFVDPAYHSSASSSGSASLRTPDDDHPNPPITLAHTPSKRSWKSWLSGKRATSLNAPSSNSNNSHSDWPATIALTSPPPPSSQKRTPLPTIPVITDGAEDSDEDSPDEVSDDEDSHSLPVSVPPSPYTPSSSFVPPPRRSLHLAKRNLAIFTANTLLPSPDPPPFVQFASGPLFPRSSNPPALLPPRTNTMLESMHRKRLLKRLEDPTLTLSQADELDALLTYSTRPAPAVKDTPTLSPFNDAHPPSSTKVFKSSPGLRSWISRPCFEDRYAILLPAQDGFIHCPVSSAVAVAALEYSDSIDIMLDPDFDISTPPSDNVSAVQLAEIELPSLALTKPVLSIEPSSVQSAPANVRSFSSHKVPSSQHNQHTSSSEPLPQQQEPQQFSMPVPAVTTPPPTVKRVVRFADSDDEEEDGTPLYILRAKKKREEKAKFLRREQLRRTAEQVNERRAKEEEEKRQKEEFMERERRRLAREQEKRERDRRLYAEEVAAARLRRESNRAGIVTNTNNPASSLISSSSSTTSLGDTESNRLRDTTKRQSHIPHLSRKEVSDTALPTISTSHSYLHPQGSSSGGSRPPSGAYSPASVSHSRPPSTYSHSSDDVRQIAIAGTGSRRNSLAASASGSHRPMPERSWTMPNWGGSTQSLQSVPPVPPVPDYLSMPLLPPTAPFMMMQYSKRQSSPSPGSSSGSRRGGSANSSSERVNQHQQVQSQQRQHSHSPHHHTPSSRRPTHERHSSGDSRRSSMPPSTTYGGSQSGKLQPRSSAAQPSTRGRMAHPQQQQQPNPWTALPSQSGRPPIAMPVNSHTHGNLATSRNSSGNMTQGHRQSVYS